MTISKQDDLIDSRDVIARIEELTAELEGVILTDDGWIIARDDDNDVQLDMNEEHDELEALKEFAGECENCAGEWPEGAALIADSYFEDYAQQFAEDIGAVASDGAWPTNHIDWDAAANEIKIDYTAVDFDGVKFWVRG